jgi:hypothetical protein
MSEDLKAGDWVRRTIHARFDTQWCEGQIPLSRCHSSDSMTVVRAHNWPAAEEAMRDGRLFHPPGVGTLERIPPDILVGDHAHEARGLKKGDYVRWESAKPLMLDNWVEGEVAAIHADRDFSTLGDHSVLSIDIRAEGRGRHQHGGTQEFGVGGGSGYTVRRIPRPGALKLLRETMRTLAVQAEYAEPDPLDVMYDGYTLRHLLGWDEAFRRRDALPVKRWLTPAQRAAISAHWSAQLRARIAASTERERNRVCVDLQDID